ncbi:MAG: hypothetical protein QF473_19580, partial [Planctomycetota bacterium]|nr:hypothetical protein [Planctomycetota bacterium]
MISRAFFLFVVLFGPFPQDLHAHAVAYYDLASLFYKSDVMVKAEALEFTEDGKFKKGRIRVLESFKGFFETGAEIQVSIKREAKPGPDLPMVVFLIHQGQNTYMPLSTGVKFLKGNEVLSYKLNHVPLLPERVPQWPESSRGQTERSASEKEFWEDFRSAKEKVRKFEVARKSNDVEALVQLATEERRSSQWNTNELSFEAAESLIRNHGPRVAFDALKKSAHLFLKTERKLRNGFGTPERFDFLWQFVRAGSQEDEAVLALELMSQNRSAGYFSKSPIR